MNNLPPLGNYKIDFTNLGDRLWILLIREWGNFKAQKAMDWLSARLKPTFDLVEKQLEHRRKEAKLLFIKTLVGGDKVQQMIIKPFFEMETEEDLKAYFSSLPDRQDITSRDRYWKS